MDGYDFMAYSPVVNGEIVLDSYIRNRLKAGLSSSMQSTSAYSARQAPSCVFVDTFLEACSRRCVAMRRVTMPGVGWLVVAVLSLLIELCRTEGGGPSLAERVIYAVNSGGEAHTDADGIHYKKDPLEGKVGKASDYGMRLPILRSNPEDQILYQTERYNEDTFGYEVPIREEGEYILVMKFAEVYFAQSQQKVFDVRLNGHTVVKDLDIFERVGHSTAHDEIVAFSIKRGKLSVQREVSTFNGKLTVEFVKGYYDNPKVCGLYVMKGTLEDVPKLQPHPGMLDKREPEEIDEEDLELPDDGRSKTPSAASKNRVQSGPRTPNPYAADNSSLMFPILVAFGVFIPTLFCLCRL